MSSAHFHAVSPLTCLQELHLCALFGTKVEQWQLPPHVTQIRLRKSFFDSERSLDIRIASSAAPVRHLSVKSCIFEPQAIAQVLQLQHLKLEYLGLPGADALHERPRGLDSSVCISKYKQLAQPGQQQQSLQHCKQLQMGLRTCLLQLASCSS